MPRPGVRARELRETLRTGTGQRGSSAIDVLSAVSEAFEGRLAQEALRSADVVISPAVHHLTGMDYGQAALAIEAGEFATLAAAETIRRRARR